MGSNYHHGDLRNALLAAAAEVIAEQGVGSFSLREVARRAGVSHTAPAHHFGDMTGLLTALAIQGFEGQYAEEREVVESGGTAAERLARFGHAYVQGAEAHPGHCQVMFRTDIIDTDNEDLRVIGQKCYGLLLTSVTELIEEEALEANPADVAALCWTAMQGLVVLRPKMELVDKMQGRPAISSAARIDRLTALMLDGIRGKEK